MAAEQEIKKGPTRPTQQQQHLKDREGVWKMFGKACQAAVLNVFWDFVRKLEARVRQSDQTGFYKRLRTMHLKWKRDRSSVCIQDEKDILLMDVNLLFER